MNLPCARLIRRLVAPFAVVFATLVITGLVFGFELQGHRGARGLWPENTLEGFRRTLGLGVDVLELDVLLSRDDVVVVHHDPRISPDTARTGPEQWVSSPAPVIRSLPYAKLLAYDIGRLRPGTRYASRYPDQTPIDGLVIPPLSEVLALGESGRIQFNIELKRNPEAADLYPPVDHFARRVVETIVAIGIPERVSIQSFDWSTLEAVEKIAPDITRVSLTAERRWLNNIKRGEVGASPWTAGLAVDDFDGSVPRMVHAFGSAVWSPYWKDLSEKALGDAKRLGLRVIVWTVNEPRDMERLIERGVDGIITDYPDRLRKVMAKRGMRLPVKIVVK